MAYESRNAVVTMVDNLQRENHGGSTRWLSDISETSPARIENEPSLGVLSQQVTDARATGRP